MFRKVERRLDSTSVAVIAFFPIFCEKIAMVSVRADGVNSLVSVHCAHI